MGEQSTENYIHKHIQSVRKKMSEIAGIIVERAEHHDESKLKDPEFSGFVQMDKEPRYEYNSQEYKDKMKRFASRFMKDLFPKPFLNFQLFLNHFLQF